MAMTRVEKMVLVYLYLFVFKDGAFTAVKGVQRLKLACERGTLKIKKSRENGSGLLIFIRI